MPIFPKYKAALLIAAIAIGLPIAAHAHRSWMLPSATVLSGNDPWVTVDAAVSNDLFYFEHFPLQLDGLVVFTPDGKPGKAENQSTGRYRSTFDVKLDQPGTWRFSVLNGGIFASYKENGQTKRWRGTPENFAKEVPADAQDLNVMESAGRIDVFVTAGKPSTDVLKPTGKGLEMVPITHPNDLYVNSTAKFKMLMDGKPVASQKIEIVRGGIRYRDKLEDFEAVTDAEGIFSVTWKQPGMYWMEANTRDKNTSIPQAKERRARYIVTLEVLPE